VDCCDAVTTLPPELLGYAHVGNSLYIDRHRKVIPNPSDKFISADHSAASIAYFFQYSWKRGTVRVRNLADHAPINYVTAIAVAQS
jgi:hypothetical protein